MAGKVCGVGWAKTGTTTLGDCLKALGYRHVSGRLDLVRHLDERDLEPVLRVAARFESMEDWPWLLLYREIDAAFPGTKFVLTTRDRPRWLQSYRNMLRTQGEATAQMNRIRQVLYDLPFPHVTDDALLARYERHVAEVREYFRDRPDDLLVVDWARGDGWPELCSFLGQPLPDRPFPHANRGSYDS